MPVLRRKFYFGVVGQQDMQPMQTVVRVQKLSGLGWRRGGIVLIWC